jgi:nucleoside-diphosphate-sugar epimerase
MSEPIRAIITGSTGMVGEGVLFECLNSPHVEQVLVINRKSCGYTHAKLKEIIHADFYDISPIANQLTGYNACFFCLGVSSVGMKEEEYFKKTYTLTLHVAKILSDVNPHVVFCYVSGSATDSTEKGRTMWARVKGKTENDLMKLPFKKVYAFRPGYMHPTRGLKNTLSYYKYLGWLYPFFKLTMPGFVSTLADLGQAMIAVARQQPKEPILEVKDIVKFSRSNT